MEQSGLIPPCARAPRVPCAPGNWPPSVCNPRTGGLILSLFLGLGLTACGGGGGGDDGDDGGGPAAPTVSLSANPASLTVGASSTLTWSSQNATACTASGGWTGDRATSGNASVTPTAEGPTSYTLSCTGAGGSGSATATVTATAAPVATGSVSGRVLNTVTGAALPGASVTSGSRSATTDGNGEFELTSVPAAERVSIQVDADGFESSYRVASVRGEQETMVSVLAVPVGASSMVMPAMGGEVRIPGSPAMVMFPAGAIAAADPVRVTITDLAPGSSPGNMPGDYTALVGGMEQQIESFGALTVNLRNDAGQPVELGTGRTATLRIPVSTLNEDPADTIPLFFYDTAAGRWVQQGTAALTTDASGRYYQGDVPHFTTWNADSLYQSVLVTGCVEDNGEPVGGVTITSTGIDYTGTSSTRSGVDGRFTIRVRPNSRLTLTGMLGQAVTSTRALNTTNEPLDITASCLQLVGDATPISVRLTWGQAPRDLDSRIQLPQGGEVSYQNRGSLEAEPFVALDTDDTTSLGPEVVTILRPRVGTYRYFVNNFSRTTAPGITGSPARIELMANGMLQVLTPPAGETASTFNWTVFDITVAADCSTSVTRPAAPWTGAFPPRAQAADPTAAFCSN